VARAAAGEDRRQELDVEFELRSAEDVAKTLGSMKGAFMKFGQMLSFVDDGLPEHVRAALSSLQDSAPPMAPSLVAEVVRQELGASPRSVFREWDERPVASASIGQVHRAVTAEGVEVAVKVQYPGVAESMEADLAQLDIARIVMPAIWKSLDADAVTNELRVRLTEELDYRLEARNQRNFCDWYDGHPFVRVPRVVDDLSTARVLTTEFHRGDRFAAFEQRSQAERDRAAEIIYRFVYRSLGDHCAFNGDPHPGNYLFHQDGAVSFLDFGLVKRLTPDERDRFVAIARAIAIEQSPSKLRTALEIAGYFVPGNPLTDQQIYDFSLLFWSYMIDDRPLTLTAEWASDTVRRYLIKDEEFAAVNKWGAVPPEFVILQRITIGLLAILGRLNATANWHAITEELWFGGPPATPLGELEADWQAARFSRGRAGAGG
jgi:predicted unusual protein kinase regulating ubiquinone biosynthesis (AarF/ABC1/UbiB family)